MQTSEYLSLLIFLSAVAIIYIFAASISVRWLLQKMGFRKAPETSKHRWFRRLILSLALLGVVCMAYGYFIEPYWLAVTRIEITTAKLAAGKRPVRIVHISDLHSDPKPRLENRLPEVIAAEKPDLIFFTGDSINSPEGLPVFKEALTKIAAIAPTFVVRGNWDTAFWRHLKLFEGTGAQEVTGEPVRVQAGDLSLWIAGAPFGDEARLRLALGAAPPDAFSIFLYHTPDLILEVAGHNLDLYCAGHTHGGQVALPLYGALLTLSKFGKQYEAGLYQVNRTALYVNRGIGMEGGVAPRVRFCARPEVTVIEIRPAAE